MPSGVLLNLLLSLSSLEGTRRCLFGSELDSEIFTLFLLGTLMLPEGELPPEEEWPEFLSTSAPVAGPSDECGLADGDGWGEGDLSGGGSENNPPSRIETFEDFDDLAEAVSVIAKHAKRRTA